jgi:hypothetical protein
LTNPQKLIAVENPKASVSHKNDYLTSQDSD